jgi:hypothetical protein
MKKSGFFSPALLSLMGVPATLALASFSFALLQQQPKAASQTSPACAKTIFYLFFRYCVNK